MLRERNKKYSSIKFVDISSDDCRPEDHQGLDYETVCTLQFLQSDVCSLSLLMVILFFLDFMLIVLFHVLIGFANPA